MSMSVSVLMPVRNGERSLGFVLKALSEQRAPFSWDFLAVDSGSTDDTPAILRQHRDTFPVPLRVHTLHESEFNHGDTRNLLAALSGGEILVYITDDAIPIGTDWLATVVSNFDDPDVAACFVRNVPRPDADILTKALSDTDPAYLTGRRVKRAPDLNEYDELDVHARRDLYYFSNTAAAVRRSTWRHHPFPRVEFGEDILLGRAIVEAGRSIVYEDRVVVHHSHDYGPEELWSRGRMDATLNAEHLRRPLIKEECEVAAQVENQLACDRAALEAAGIAGQRLDMEVLRARRLREALFRGVHEGSQSPRRFRPTAMLPTPFPFVGYFGAAAEKASRDLAPRGWPTAQLESCPNPAADGSFVALVDGDTVERPVLDRLVAARVPTLLIVTEAFANQHQLPSPMLAAYELGNPQRVENPPWQDLLDRRSADTPLMLAVWRSEDELVRFRGQGDRVVDAAAERLLALEPRLRDLACRARRALPQRWADLPGTAAVLLEGTASRLDQRMIGLPQDGAAEFDLGMLPAGSYELLIFLDANESERSHAFGGSASIDDAATFDLGPCRPWSDGLRCFRLPLELAAGRHAVRLEGRYGNGDPGYMRVARILLLDSRIAADRFATCERSYDFRGQDGLASGACVVQDCDAVMLGPETARVEFTPAGLLAGAYEITVSAVFVAGERRYTQRGEILINDTSVHSFGPWKGRKKPLLCESSVIVRLAAGARIAVSPARRHLLRVQRLRIRWLDGAGDHGPVRESRG